MDSGALVVFPYYARMQKYIHTGRYTRSGSGCCGIEYDIALLGELKVAPDVQRLDHLCVLLLLLQNGIARYD